MRKYFIWMAAVALMLAGCGEKKTGSGDESGEGFECVVDILKETIDEYNELKEKVESVAKEIGDRYDEKSKGKRLSSKEKRKEVEECLAEISEATKEDAKKIKEIQDRWENLGDELGDYTIPTEINRGLPLELKEPFRIVESKRSGGSIELCIGADVKLTSKGKDFNFKDLKAEAVDENEMEINTYNLNVLKSDGKRHTLSFSILVNPFRGSMEKLETLASAKKLIIISSSYMANGDETVCYRGELGLFELKGQVKECEWTYPWSTFKRTFDENGFWLTHDGQSLSAIYPSGIQRDSQGRIIKGMIDMDGNGEDYEYNADGSKKSYNYHYFDEVSLDKYKYDDKGVMTSSTSAAYGEDEDATKTTYKIVKTDDHGNWTERKAKTGEEETVEKRKITYY